MLCDVRAWLTARNPCLAVSALAISGPVLLFCNTVSAAAASGRVALLSYQSAFTSSSESLLQTRPGFWLMRLLTLVTSALLCHRLFWDIWLYGPVSLRWPDRACARGKSFTVGHSSVGHLRATWFSSCIYSSFSTSPSRGGAVCVCVCVCERERERENYTAEKGE